MYYVYILKSEKDRELYTGCTKDLKKRLNHHNSGKIMSTCERIPFQLIFYEAFLDKHDAFMREQWLKTGWGRNHLQKTFTKNTPQFLKKFRGLIRQTLKTRIWWIHPPKLFNNGV